MGAEPPAGGAGADSDLFSAADLSDVLPRRGAVPSQVWAEVETSFMQKQEKPDSHGFSLPGGMVT